MKKPYSLDFDIKFDTERTQHVANILDNLETDPSNTELEQMADYILFGKDEKFMSARDRKEITQPKRRFNSWATKDEKNESLDAILENPATATDVEIATTKQATRFKVVKPEIRRPTYDENGTMVDPGDSDVPGMVELWERIDTLQERYDMYKGKIPPNEYVRAHPLSGYQLYKFGHMLIDIRRHQYFLKDAYKPSIKFFNAAKPDKPDLDLCGTTGLWLSPEEWCARKRNPKPHDMPQPALEDAPMDNQGRLYWKISDNDVDFENPEHIMELLNNYVSLLKRSYGDPYNNTRTMLFDLERIIEHANLTDVEQFILEQRVAHKNIFVTQKLLADENIILSDLQIRNLSRKKIPTKLAQTALRLRLESQARNNEIETLECSKCGQHLPKHPYFFARSRDKRTGYCSQCKACQKAKRGEKKNANMP